jgi:hypothetical protein
MFEKAMEKSVRPYLQPGEELLNVTLVQGKGLAKVFMAGGIVGAMAAGARRDRKAAEAGGDVQLSSKMGLALTDRRLLLFKAAGAMTLKAQELLTEVPVAELDNVEVGKGVVTKPVTLTIRGEAFQVETPRAANTDKLLEAFAAAKAAVAA